MRARLPICFVLSMAISAACGGRSMPGDDDDGQSAGGSSTSGKSGHAGTTGGGGRRGTAGASAQGGVSVGGFATAGTTAAGGACLCPEIACPVGTQPVPTPDGCCYQCESLGCGPCPLIACGSGSHLEVLPQQCCMTCVADDCNDQVAAYLSFREQLLQKYSAIQCMTDADCTYYYDKNPCQAGCGFPIATSIVGSVDMNLQSFAAQTCSPSCLHPTPPCNPAAAARCVANRCQ